MNAYLVSGPNVFVEPASKRSDSLGKMEWGNKPTDGGHLILSTEEKDRLISSHPNSEKFIRQYVGSHELIKGSLRWCVWITDDQKEQAEAIPDIRNRITNVAGYRSSSPSADTRPAAAFPHRFRQIQAVAKETQILVSVVSSEARDYLPAQIFGKNVIGSNKVFALYDSEIWNLAIIVSRLHWVWVGAVCVRLEMRFSYGNTLAGTLSRSLLSPRRTKPT